MNTTERELYSALPVLIAYSGCDMTSAFMWKGKVAALKLVQYHPDFLESFLRLRTSHEISDCLFEQLEHFTCRLYGSPLKDINKLRHQKFAQRFNNTSATLLNSYSGVDMTLLPPCSHALKMNMKRANYQAQIWLLADQSAAGL